MSFELFFQRIVEPAINQLKHYNHIYGQLYFDWIC